MPDSQEDAPDLPDIYGLHLRHAGVYEPVCTTYADAAAICFDRHHKSPLVLQLEDDGRRLHRRIRWEEPSDGARRANVNTDVATERGAYAVAVSALESTREMFTLIQSEHRTGADYLLVPAGSPLLENAIRLEVSGTDANESGVRARLRGKRQQLARHGDDPGVACVVGFKVKQVLIQSYVPGDGAGQVVPSPGRPTQ